MEKEKTKHVSVNMPENLYNQIVKSANTNHRDTSKEVIYACKVYLEQGSQKERIMKLEAEVQALKEMVKSR